MLLGLPGEGLSMALFLVVSQTTGITLLSLMTLLLKRPWLLQFFVICQGLDRGFKG